MHPTHATYAAKTSLVRRRLGTSSSTIYLHEGQTTLSLTNNKFTTSTHGVSNNLYSSCGSEISLVWVRFCLCANFPQSDQTYFWHARLAVLEFSSIDILNIPFLVFRVWNPARVPDSLRFKFKERLYIVCK